MPPSLDQVLVVIPYLYGTFVSLTVTTKVLSLSFCGYNIEYHFYCNSLPLLSLLWSDMCKMELMIMIFSVFNLVLLLLIVLVSYLLILVAIFKMNSAEGRCKAFPTCRSHSTVATVFYGTLIFMYMQPESSHSFNTDKVVSVFYSLMIPMLSPLSYSMRNKDVKYAGQRMWEKLCNILS